MPCIYTFNGTQYTETDLSALYKDVRAFLNSPRTVSEEDEEVKTSSPVNKFAKKNIFTVTPQQGVVDNKAAIKASIATQYIGFGEGIRGSKGQRSSSEIYREQAGKFANTGNYSANDVIFVSVPGKRGAESKRKEQQDKTINEAIKAVEAGATILTDNKSYIDSSDYNEGEKRLYKNMEAKGYNYSEITVDGQVIGIWSKSTTPTVSEGIEINSKQTGLGNDLTNVHYATNGKSKFDIKPSDASLTLTPEAKKTWGESVEAWYKSNNAKSKGIPEGTEGDAYDMKLMIGLITDKLKQYPDLVTQITERGGLAFLDKSTHTMGTGRWSSKNPKNMFMNALKQAYRNVSTTPTVTTEVKGDLFNSLTDFTPEKRKEILNTFSEKYKMTEDQALTFINDALQQDRDATITLLKECY